MKYPQFWIFYIIFSFYIVIASETEYVSEIKFIGNSSLTESELRSIIKLQPPEFFARSELSAKKLKRDETEYI